MKEIKLTHGKVALIDDEYYEILNKYSWSLTENCYACTAIKKKITRMHHMIIGKPINGLVTDHIDGNGLNNRK